MGVRRAVTCLLLIGSCQTLPATLSAARREPVRRDDSATSEEPAAAQWLGIGTFKGAAGQGLIGRLSNWIYEYETDDSLFRDLGDLGFGFGWDIGKVEFDWDFFFRHRVVTAHEAIAPGESITADDISRYRTVDVSRTRLRASYRYLTDLIIDDDGVGVEVEGGFAVGLAHSRAPTVHTDEALETILLGTPKEEHKQFKDENHVSMDDHGIVYVTAGSAAAVVDSMGGYLGNKFADTERAAVYWDTYSEPIMLFPKSGLPLKMRIFMGDDPTLATGDTLTFTSFVGISPIVAGIKDYGASIGYKRFWRFIRETTVVKEPDDIVRVRVRNWRAHGGDFTPFKLRPEVNLWIFRIGYTFFETVRDRFRERVADSVYRIDVGTDTGMEFFRHLIRKSGRVQTTPQLPEVPEGPGIEILAAEVDRGKSQNMRVRANFFHWLRYRKSKLGTTRRIYAQDAELREVIRARTKDYRKRFGRPRDRRVRSMITTQADVRWRDEDADETRLEDEKLAVIFSTTYSSRYASGAEVKALAAGVETLLGMREPPPIFDEIRSQKIEGPIRLMLDLRLSFGPRQLERALAAEESETWLVLAELLLGPEHREVWRSEARRFWWEPGAPPYRGVDPPVVNISRYYDELRGFQGRPAKRSRIFNPAEYSSRDLYRLAATTFAKLQKLKRVLREEADCLRCLTQGYSTGKDILLIQALANRFAGGVEQGGVGYDLQILVGDMVRPLKLSNGIVHGYQIPRGAEIVQTAETIWDSPPRLRAGQMLLNASGADVDLPAGAPCWKLRLFSDHRFSEDLSLRLHWRHAKIRADRSIEVGFASLGEPRDAVEAMEAGRIDLQTVRDERPLGSEYSTSADRTQSLRSVPLAAAYEQARYFYEVPLPWLDAEYGRKGYNLLLRVINRDGLPVTEEQEILMKLPKGWQQQVPRECWEGTRTAGDAAP